MSSDLKKTIKINPELFTISGSDKTRKNRERKHRPAKPLLINPNSLLKNKLLNKIREHKNKEQNKEKNDSKENNQNKNNDSKENNQNKNNDSKENNQNKKVNEFTDEFIESMNYLTELSNKKKENDKKVLKEKIFNKTIKNPNPQPVLYPTINLELPDELKEPFQFQPQTYPEIKINTYTVDNNVPYGCLKNGIKPTYRTWNVTKKRTNGIKFENTVVNNENTDREKKLEIIKQKLKMQENNLKNEGGHSNKIMINIENNLKNDKINIENNNLNNECENKKYIKKTIRRKYTLGRSNICRKVGVLIKDNNTRKQIMDAHKELKRKNINEIKTHLREHDLIKVGSNAPNDVIRSIYESSMLTGIVNNNNKETMLHNFINNK
jgi:hypothetical protein